MKLINRGFGYRTMFDGDIIHHAPIWKLPWQKSVELPVNVILDYHYTASRVVGCLKLYINRYRFGQTKPEIRVLRPMYLFCPSAEFERVVLAALDGVIESNLSGLNHGLNHLSTGAMHEFYSRKKHRQLASMRIVHRSGMPVDSPDQVITMPESHHMAS